MSAFELELTVCMGGRGHVTTTVAAATAAELESLAETTAAAIKSWQDEREHKGVPTDTSTTSGFTVVRRMGAWLDRLEADPHGNTVTIEDVRLRLQLALWSDGPVDAATLKALGA